MGRFGRMPVHPQGAMGAIPRLGFPNPQLILAPCRHVGVFKREAKPHQLVAGHLSVLSPVFHGGHRIAREGCLKQRQAGTHFGCHNVQRDDAAERRRHQGCGAGFGGVIEVHPLNVAIHVADRASTGHGKRRMHPLPVQATQPHGHELWPLGWMVHRFQGQQVHAGVARLDMAGVSFGHDRLGAPAVHGRGRRP